jgi:hypothetical protein
MGLQLGDVAADFKAVTSEGRISFRDWTTTRRNFDEILGSSTPCTRGGPPRSQPVN